MHRATSAWSRPAGMGVLALALAFALTLTLAEAPARAADRDRARLLELTNRARQRRDVRKLDINYRLSRKAKRHSEEMARRGRLYHSSNVPRYLKGVHWHCWGENVGKTSAWIPRLHHEFMRSAVHRANILDRRFDRVGIGIVRDRGKLWATVVFYG